MVENHAKATVIIAAVAVRPEVRLEELACGLAKSDGCVNLNITCQRENDVDCAISLQE